MAKPWREIKSMRKFISLGGNKEGSVDIDAQERAFNPEDCGACQEPDALNKDQETPEQKQLRSLAYQMCGIKEEDQQPSAIVVEVLGGPGKLTYSSLSSTDIPGYEDLRRVLELAYSQAARGKGKERHADGRAFMDQPIMLIQEMIGPGFGLGQACKKLQESQRLEWSHAQNELLGAIVYIAAAYLHREKNNV